MSKRKKRIGVGVGYAVAGPVGALAGASIAGTGAYDMSDIPFGVHVEAEHEDSETERKWTLRFLSAIPAEAHAMLRVLDDAGQRIAGRAPFADDEGAFVASARIVDASCELRIPLGAIVYASPKHLSLEVSLWDGTGPAVRPAGKAVLDADLPKRP